MDKNLTMTYEEHIKEQERIHREEQNKQNRQRADVFRRIGLASFIYAVVYTFCLYQNLTGITSPVWAAVSAVYLCYVIKSSGKSLKKDSWFLIAIFMLLGISNFLTGNLWIVWLNYLVMFVLLVGILLHNFYEDMTWDFGKYGEELITAVFGAVGKCLTPFSDGEAFLKQYRTGENKKTGYILAGIGIAIPCVLILTGLLCQADMVFADMIGRALKNIIFPRKLFGILFMLCFGFFSSYCVVRYIGLHTRKETVEQKKTAEPLLAIALLGTVLIVYLIFCGIQVCYLFLGAGTLPEGVTYADYARTGFFQLLFICLLNIAAVLAIKKYFRENKALNGCLLAVCGCTFIMTASSAYRMLLYIGAYYLTTLRFFVLAALSAIAVVMVGVTVFIIKQEFPLLKFTVAALCMIYTALSFSRMDYIIADYNLNRCAGRAEAIDYDYIACLSTDAAPVVAEYGKTHPELMEKYVLWEEKTDAGYGEDASGRDSWQVEETLEWDEDMWFYRYWRENRESMEEKALRKFNVSHAQAARLGL